MKDFKELTRAYTLPMSVAPFFIAVCFALGKPFETPFSFIFDTLLALIAVVFVHMAGNLFDDYLDVIKQLQTGVKLSEINFKNKNKARLILNGTFSLNIALIIVLFLLLPAFFIGLYFAYYKGMEVVFYMFLTLVLVLIYPKSSEFGLSEIIIGILFGPLLINAAYFVLCGQHSLSLFAISIASGLITSVLLIVHSLMDYEFDVEEGKKSLPVILKDKNITINIISLIILTAYFILSCIVLGCGFSKAFLIPIFATVLIAAKLIISLYDYIKMKNSNLVPKWYFGVMENWDEIVKNNYAYFMFRFYLARNLAVIFNVSIILACLINYIIVQWNYMKEEVFFVIENGTF